MTDEARLIREAAAGDREAFACLVRSRQGRVFWTAYQVVGSEEDARDVAQEVFIRLWDVLPRYQAAQRFDTWLYRITINRAIDLVRRRRARPDLGVASLPAFDGADPSAGPAEILRAGEIQRIFLRLAARLSPKQRAVFVLREMNDLDTAQIAEILEVTPSTVRNHLHQARKILRRGLAAHFPEYGSGGEETGS
ncbi:MAG: RNA polymerase sigma factor [Acidobacteriota bacterium]